MSQKDKTGRYRTIGLAAVAVAAAVALAAPTVAVAAPAGHTQEGSGGDGPQPIAEPAPAGRHALVAPGDTAAATAELDEIKATVAEHVKKLEAAEKSFNRAVGALADADVAVSETERRIEELTERSDQVVVGAFVTPPSQSTLEVLATPSGAEATVKDAVLGLNADATAGVLADLNAARTELEEQQAAQEEARRKAEAARAEAEAALAELEDAIGQQSQFVMALTQGLDADAARRASDDPALAKQLEARRKELRGELDEMRKEREYAAALEALAEAQRREEERRRAEAAAAAEEASSGGAGSAPAPAPSTPSSGGGIVCPVNGPVSFTDTWGASRGDGRYHQGVDMMAASGTPTVAPVSGQVEHRSSSLGGLSWYIYGDDGNTYYGTHLSGFASQGAGWVAAGTTIGYVGSSGNASASAPHLHFEYHPGGGGAVNPYPLVAAAC